MKKGKKEIVYDQNDPNKALYFQDKVNQTGRVYSEFIEKFYRYTYDTKENRIRKQVCYAFKETYPTIGEVWYRISIVKTHKSIVNVLPMLRPKEYENLFTETFEYSKENKSWYSLTERDGDALRFMEEHFSNSMETYRKKYEHVKHKKETIQLIQTWGVRGISEDYKPDNEDELIIRS